jgi:amphi-Trp domain-containing protein
MEKNKVSLKQVVPLNEAVALLQRIIRDLESGTVTLEEGGNKLSMMAPAQVAVEIEAKQKEGKEKFSLELSWKRHIEVDRRAALEESLEVSDEQAASPLEAPDADQHHQKKSARK